VRKDRKSRRRRGGSVVRWGRLGAPSPLSPDERHDRRERKGRGGVACLDGYRTAGAAAAPWRRRCGGDRRLGSARGFGCVREAWLRGLPAGCGAGAIGARSADARRGLFQVRASARTRGTRVDDADGVGCLAKRVERAARRVAVRGCRARQDPREVGLGSGKRASPVGDGRRRGGRGRPQGDPQSDQSDDGGENRAAHERQGTTACSGAQGGRGGGCGAALLASRGLPGRRFTSKRKRRSLSLCSCTLGIFRGRGACDRPHLTSALRSALQSPRDDDRHR
jgi:hypothetical protein